MDIAFRGLVVLGGMMLAFVALFCAVHALTIAAIGLLP